MGPEMGRLDNNEFSDYRNFNYKIPNLTTAKNSRKIFWFWSCFCQTQSYLGLKGKDCMLRVSDCNFVILDQYSDSISFANLVDGKFKWLSWQQRCCWHVNKFIFWVDIVNDSDFNCRIFYFQKRFVDGQTSFDHTKKYEQMSHRLWLTNYRDPYIRTIGAPSIIHANSG